MNAGLANESAVSQMKATYFEVENSVLDLKEQINQAENSLALLLAESPQSFDRGRLADQEFPEEFRWVCRYSFWLTVRMFGKLSVSLSRLFM